MRSVFQCLKDILLVLAYSPNVWLSRGAVYGVVVFSAADPTVVPSFIGAILVYVLTFCFDGACGHLVSITIPQCTNLVCGVTICIGVA